MSGFAGVSVFAYGNVGNSREHAYATSSNADPHVRWCERSVNESRR